MSIERKTVHGVESTRLHVQARLRDDRTHEKRAVEVAVKYLEGEGWSEKQLIREALHALAASDEYEYSPMKDYGSETITRELVEMAANTREDVSLLLEGARHAIRDLMDAAMKIQTITDRIVSNAGNVTQEDLRQLKEARDNMSVIENRIRPSAGDNARGHATFDDEDEDW